MFTTLGRGGELFRGPYVGVEESAEFTTNPVVAKFSAVEDLSRQLEPYYGS